MKNAQKAFKCAYGVARKNAAYILDRSADYYGQTDDEAFEYYVVKCVAKSIHAPSDMPMPSIAYRAAVAAAAVLADKMSPAAVLTPQEKLAEIARVRAEPEIDFD